MELVPAQGEQTAQRDVKAVHGNVLSGWHFKLQMYNCQSTKGE